MLCATFDDPLTEIHYGDCRLVIDDNISTWRECFDFIFADPPFNVKQEYDVYYDGLTDEEFIKFFAEWISYCAQCLRPGGVFAINIPDQLVLMTLQTMQLLELPRIAWVIWHYRFGQCNDSNWINSKAHCLIFQLPGGMQTWNPDAVMVESDRASKYNDSRTMFTATPGKRVPLDVWSVENDGAFWGRVQGNSNERAIGHPNQLPEKYLERLIRAYTNVGDLVLDPFGGTGTTATVARALGRQCVTIDISEQYCVDIAERVKQGAIRV